MMRFSLTGLIAIFAISPVLAADLARLNVVLFVSDDHGQDAGCYGNKVIKTPHLDALALEGTLYRNAFCTTASCSPSRSVLLSGLHNHTNGQYSLQHGVHHGNTFTSVQSLPAILSKNGYRTARMGKLHVEPVSVYSFQKVLPMGPGGARNAVSMAEKCKEFIHDKETPFFLYFCPTDPHRSGTVGDSPEHPDRFANGPKYPGVQEITYAPKDVVVPSFLPDNAAVRAELAEYYQSVSRMDQGIGKLVQILKDEGQWDNTVFIYLSDNGIPMPGAKTTLYDPGMKLPLVVRAPGLKNRGVVSEAMISWVDITPTILDFAGIKEVKAPPLVQGNPDVPGGKKKDDVTYAFQGRSFRRTLEGGRAEGWNEVFGSHTFHEITMYYPMRAIRTDRYKLILNLAHQLPFPAAQDLYDSATWQSVVKKDKEALYGKRRIGDYIQRPRYELYDLQNDPDEVVNLAEKPDAKKVFEELSARLKQFQKKTHDPWLVKYEHE
jgi:N-sulfoglucosamine sulfohydrolase